jgi:cytochrome c1
LYWAGQDGNWNYADYQIEKIRIAIANGLERRPKRAKAAEHFLNVVIPTMQKALEKRDTIVFNKNFKILTNSCISCHAMEKVPYFTVKKPLYRQSPIRK